MEQAINWLLGIILFFLVWLFILFVYLTSRKAIENSKRRKIDYYKEKYRENMFRYLYTGQKSKQLIPDHPVKFLALEELLGDFADVAKGGDLEQRMKAFAEKYFHEEYNKKLVHRRWSVRMNVLYNIEAFQMDTFMGKLGEMYEGRRKISESEEIQIIKLLTMFDHPKLFDYIVSSSKKYADFIYRILFSEMSDPTFYYFLAKFHTLPVSIKSTIIDVLGIQNRLEHVKFLTEQLKQPNDELRIRTLKALAHILYPMPIEDMEKHISSRLFEERIMALKICAAVRKRDYIPILISKMSDPIFAVRKQAGYSISRYPNAREIFQEIIDTSTDTFAKDMAQEWLERGIIHGNSTGTIS
ncbi:HEAT repeat domain-containing protein [Bacillus suaedaesalsae]|uniref:HEAT repeat domain-containing protein n=1 Tax=Bacillus suaedaesalsae TaxID=2810349 RepID=A0ABS2DGN4_9BACI|nr:HEAT repeat domain-containing protein [Bacillus suaedaesalsae]MBM6617646.1 HEAT repeat domain-containing protein [Bacillus suaedaesalsae]